MAAVVRVQPSEEGWQMKLDDGRAWPYRTQREAVRDGRELARAWNLELVLYSRDGVVRDRIPYGGGTGHLPATRL